MSKPDDLPAVLRAIRINGMSLIYAEEAADEIEQLRTERDDLRREWQAEQHVVEVLRAENAALRADLEKQAHELWARIDELDHANVELRADAERYRWLKENATTVRVGGKYFLTKSVDAMDHMIDAARKE